MKNVKIYLVSFIISSVLYTNAQSSTGEDFILGYETSGLNSTDTIPDYTLKNQKFKLTGIVYQNDGITPAKDVIICFSQADEDGNFDIRRVGNKKSVYHRSFIKTDADGKYTFYTFIPGNDRRYNQLKEISILAKAPNKEKYELESLLFDEDPLLTNRCRKRIAKRSDTTRILKLQTVDSVLVAKRDIILPRLKESSNLEMAQK